jgi:predicted DNA-binding transcriptional regulator YafY
MSKRAYISRYLLILKKLKVRPYSTYLEIQAYIENQFEYMQMYDDDLQIGSSKRTMQRDIRDIRNMFGVDIEYSKSQKGYFINHNEAESMNFQRMMEAFEIFNSLNIAQDLAPFVHLEKRKPQGTENLYGLLHAIKNNFLIKFDYQKFWEEESQQRLAEPYALKEFKSRWYIIAKDNKDATIKSFALDRLSHLEITNIKFDFPMNYNIEESYRYCFGIISPNDEEPQDILLSFDPYQGKYIKTLPLHESQQVIIDNENELQVKLKLCVTHDLLMELLSFGDNVKVLQPKSLAEEIRLAHQKAFKQYANK